MAVRIVMHGRLWGDTEKGPLQRTDIDDFAFYAMIGILLGGRIGYILFYTIPYEPQKLFGPGGDIFFIFRMWEGGMAFHGGLIGAVVAVFATAWIRKIPALSLGDVACAAADRHLPRAHGQLHQWRTRRPSDGMRRRAMRFPDYNWATREWGPVDAKPLVPPKPDLRSADRRSAAVCDLCALCLEASPAAQAGPRRRHLPDRLCGLPALPWNFREPDNFTRAACRNRFTMGMLLSIPMILAGRLPDLARNP